MYITKELRDVSKKYECFVELYGRALFCIINTHGQTGSVINLDFLMFELFKEE